MTSEKKIPRYYYSCYCKKLNTRVLSEFVLHDCVEGLLESGAVSSPEKEEDEIIGKVN